MAWSRHFDDPILLPPPDGRALRTLGEAGAYVMALSPKLKKSPEWQAAAATLLLVVELNGPTMMARIGVIRAINRGWLAAGPRRKRTKAYRIVR